MSKKRKSTSQYFFNPEDPKKSFDVYEDKNPDDTIPIKYKTQKDVVLTIKKLERLYKKGDYTHKRIFQVAMIMMVRLKVIVERFNKAHKRYRLSKKYKDFINKRTTINKDNNKDNNKKRKALVFKIPAYLDYKTKKVSDKNKRFLKKVGGKINR